MAADRLIALGLAESYSKAELEGFKKTLLEALISLDRITGNQMEGISFQFAPRSEAEVRRALKNILAALGEDDGYQHSMSRRFNFATRQIE